MPFDHFDIIAIVIGVMLTLRKLDVKSREVKDFPSVPEAEFERWRGTAALAYSIGATASFFRVVFHFGSVWYVNKHAVRPEDFRWVGLAVDLAWIAGLIVCFWRAHVARRLRERLGIRLERVRPESG